MPTRAGWAIVGLGAGTVLVGRLFGWLELFALGVGLAALVGIAVLMNRKPRSDSRTLTCSVAIRKASPAMSPRIPHFTRPNACRYRVVWLTCWANAGSLS